MSVLKVLLPCCLLLVACDKPPDPQAEQSEPVQVAPPAPTAAASRGPAAEADKYFQQRCVVCHGNTGHGDGPGAAALDPKPRTFADAEWQDKTTDEHLAKVITEGGAAVGLSPGMPAHADLKNKPEVLKALIEKIRKFRQE